MLPSRLETNLCRLVSRCETLASEGSVNDWRLEKYVECLEALLEELRLSPSKPPNDKFEDYTRRVHFLKGLIAADKMPTASAKAMANQFLSVGSRTTANKISKEIKMQTTGKYSKEMRKELLGEDENTSSLRRRGTSDDSSEDIDALLKYHQNMQEKITEEMVSLAQNLKENSLLAGKIVRSDTEVLERSSKFADQNFEKLKIESERLERHARGCSLWVMVMLVVVITTFMSMIMFMKVFKKG